MSSQPTRITRFVALTSAVILVGCANPDADVAAQSTAAATRTAAASKVDPCTVVTPEEVEAAVGWKVQKFAPNPGAGCHYTGPNELTNIVSVIVSAGMQPMSSSEAMAAWRLSQTKQKSYADIKFIIEPISDVGVPAIRNEVEGAGIVGVESYVRGRLLTISTPTLEAGKALTRSAIKRIP
jgi:hypothetical protein